MSGVFPCLLCHYASMIILLGKSHPADDHDDQVSSPPAKKLKSSHPVTSQ